MGYGNSQLVRSFLVTHLAECLAFLGSQQPFDVRRVGFMTARTIDRTTGPCVDVGASSHRVSVCSFCRWMAAHAEFRRRFAEEVFRLGGVWLMATRAVRRWGVAYISFEGRAIMTVEAELGPLESK